MTLYALSARFREKTTRNRLLGCLLLGQETEQGCLSLDSAASKLTIELKR
jgi:hypothetical protein